MGKELVEVSDDEVFVQSNKKSNTENIITLEDNILGKDGTIVPEVGTKFKHEK